MRLDELRRIVKEQTLAGLLSKARTGDVRAGEWFSEFALRCLKRPVKAKLPASAIGDFDSCYDEAVVRCLNAQFEVRSDGELVSFLVMTLHRLLVDDYRKVHGRGKSPRRFTSLDTNEPHLKVVPAADEAADNTPSDPLTATQPGPEPLYAALQQTSRLDELLQRLSGRPGPPGRRIWAVYLSVLKHLSHEEIQADDRYRTRALVDCGKPPSNWANFVSQDIKRGLEELRNHSELAHLIPDAPEARE